MKRITLTIAAIIYGVVVFAQYDWDGIDIPAEAGNSEFDWEMVEALSDDFNYETPSGSDKGEIFNSKWEDGYINSWPGFGNTIWTPDNSKVTNGNLELKATVNPEKAGHNFFSAIHARNQVVYPVYVETRMKVMNAVMANAVWMLSTNSREEIDIVEAYGSSWSESTNSSKNWFAERMHLSHHTFSENKEDYQPTDAGSYYRLMPHGSLWRNGFYTVGVYWRDPFHLEYYIDGNLVRTVSGADIIDPHEHLDGNGLSSPESIIFSGAAQGWQVSNGVYPTAAELAVEEDNIFKIDWIRTYKRVEATNINKTQVSDLLVFANPLKNTVRVKEAGQIKTIKFYQIDGNLVKQINVDLKAAEFSVADLSKGFYIMNVIDKNGIQFSERVLRQ
ncbi:T9SS type A sorting domain-containing protein [Saccharicrinis aurantiacus]|uniref:T9SS type A sorting domain-containing protein n=1 Tax=Saccharicrinis aurantiacus TaxID=1849719 RepID=UPI002490CF8F|nr:T9SS type A sorting domain-containing protein [Saccharicrinis aurantiacus]